MSPSETAPQEKRRCEYISAEFYRGYNAAQSYLADGTDQCWMTDTREFRVGDDVRHYCIFHAPSDVPADDWPLCMRGQMQADRLIALLDDWQLDNKGLTAKNQMPLSFSLPFLQCGALSLRGKDYVGALALRRSHFSGDVWIHSTHFCHQVDFLESRIDGDFRTHRATVDAQLNLERAQIGQSLLLSLSAF